MLQAHDNVEVRPGSLETLPIDDGQLDLAMMGARAAPRAGSGAWRLPRSARVLKSGGRVLIIDMLPHDRADYQQQMGHVWLGIPERRCERCWRAAGFDNVRIHALPIDADAKGPRCSPPWRHNNVLAGVSGQADMVERPLRPAATGDSEYPVKRQVFRPAVRSI